MGSAVVGHVERSLSWHALLFSCYFEWPLSGRSQAFARPQSSLERPRTGMPLVSLWSNVTLLIKIVNGQIGPEATIGLRLYHLCDLTETML